MSTVAIKYDGTDITADVMYRTARFTSQVNGAAGTCTFRVRDSARTYSFINGKKIELFIDGTIEWTGFVQKVKRVFPFPAQATTPLPTRYIEVEGADINILFNKRYLVDSANPSSGQGHDFPAPTADTTAISYLFANYLDLTPDGIDTTTMVTGVANVNVDQVWNGFGGSMSLGEAMGSIIRATSAIFYINPDKQLVYCDVDTPTAAYGLSDGPVAGSSVGYREMEVLYDGASLDNDHLAWGMGYGSQVPVFDRVQDATSQAAHGRWQASDIALDVYKQNTINRIASQRVNGSPSNHRGGKDDKVSVICTTHTPGFRVAQKVTFDSHAFGFSDVIPIRQMEITFDTPKDPRYRLTLSHEIDAPWGFIDVYFPRLQKPPALSIPPISGIAVSTTTPGGCDCGITDTFTRTISGGWGTADCGLTWYTTGVTASVSPGYGQLQQNGGGSSTLNTGYAELDFSTNIESDVTFDITVTAQDTSEPSGSSQVRSMQMGTNAGQIYTWTVIQDSTGSTLTLTKTFELTDATTSFSFTTGTTYHARWQVQTSVEQRIRFWTGSTEPSTWTLTQSLVGETPSTKMQQMLLILRTQSAGGSVGGMTVQYGNFNIAGVDACSQLVWDNFNRTVASGWGTSTSGYAWTDSGPGTGVRSVDGSEAKIVHNTATAGQTWTWAHNGPWAGNEWTMTARFKPAVQGSGTGNRFTSFSLCDASYSDYKEGLAISYWDSTIGGPGVVLTNAYGASYYHAMTFDPTAWYFVKWQHGTAENNWKVWKDGDAEPAWFGTLSGSPGGHPYFSVFKQGGDNVNPEEFWIDWIDFAYIGRPCYWNCTATLGKSGHWYDDFNRTIALGTSNNFGTPDDFPSSGGTFTYSPAGNGYSSTDVWEAASNGSAGNPIPATGYTYTDGAYAYLKEPGSSYDGSNGVTFSQQFTYPIEVLWTNISIAYIGTPVHPLEWLAWQGYLSHAYGVNNVGSYPWMAFSFGHDSSPATTWYLTLRDGAFYSDPSPWSSGTFTVNRTWNESNFDPRSPFHSRWRIDDAGAHMKVWQASISEPSGWDVDYTFGPGKTAADLAAMTYPFRSMVIENDTFTIAGLGGETASLSSWLKFDRVDVWAACPPVNPAVGGSTVTSGLWCESVVPSGAVITTTQAYAAGSVEVYISGVRQPPSAYTETSPTNGTITLSFTPASGEAVRVCYVIPGGSLTGVGSYAL